MALPSSGPLSINDIRVELEASATNQSLGAFSDTAGFAAPDAITDFYGFVNIPTGLSSELYSNNLQSSTSWDLFQGANEIDLSPYNGRTCRLAVHYSNGTASTSYRGDFQIGSIVTLGTTTLNFQTSTTDWQTTRANTAATSTAYNAATFYTLADGTTSQRWNRRNTSAPPSSGTGLAPGTGDPPNTSYYAYTETSGGSMLGFGFWLRSPAVTFASSNSNDIILAIAHFGSNMGTYKVFLDVTV
tara:strand:+ start:237 stop:968 length:732 start_codon:yes stop_codon:yes gene_type:complete